MTAAPGPAGPARVSRGGILATAFMFVCAIYFLLPAWWLVVSSTKGPGTLYSSEGFWFSQPHFRSNLTGLFSYDSGIYWRWLANSQPTALVRLEAQGRKKTNNAKSPTVK